MGAAKHLMAAQIETIVRLALAQKGKPYVFGVEVVLADPSPRAFDCSELVQWVCAQAGVQPEMPDGTWYQQSHCAQHGLLVPLDEGIDTRGALLFNHRDAAGQPVSDMAARPATAHVAISLGDGTTIEAMGTNWGTCLGRANGRNWTHAARIPGADYAPADPLTSHTLDVPHAQPNSPGGPPWMKTGSSGDDVRQLQTMLKAVGVDRIPHHVSSGVFSDLTDVAIRLVQEFVRTHYDSAMDVDGDCGPVTWGWVEYLAKAMPGDVPPVGGPPPRRDLAPIRRGAASGVEVERLQQMVVAIGVRRLGELTPSGVFGPTTDLALRLFQWHVKSSYDHSMDVDGICGPITWAWLQKLAGEAAVAVS
jgi:cell wall-associated NlpC family hydrolase